MVQDLILFRPELWRIIGLLISDGESTGHDNTRIVFSNTNETLINLFEESINEISSYGCRKSLKIDKRSNRKLLWRIRPKGRIRLVIKQVTKNAENYVKNLDSECLWQFVTGLYEGDGTVTFRPNSHRACKKYYLEIEIKLAKKEENLARIIAEKLDAFDIKAHVRTQDNYVRFRISSMKGIKNFFNNSHPLIKNPNSSASFINTKAMKQEETVKLFYNIKTKYSEHQKSNDIKVL